MEEKANLIENEKQKQKIKDKIDYQLHNKYSFYYKNENEDKFT